MAATHGTTIMMTYHKALQYKVGRVHSQGGCDHQVSCAVLDHRDTGDIGETAPAGDDPAGEIF